MNLTTEGCLLDTEYDIIAPSKRAKEVSMNRFENGVSSAEDKEKVLSELALDEGTDTAGRTTTKLSPKFLHIFEWQIGTACNKKWHR